jgi:predicted Rossmann-fold nucleotide-binding protein
MGKDFWSPMMDWIKKTMAEDYKTISPGDLDLIHLTDDVEEVVDVIAEFYKQASLRPNF